MPEPRVVVACHASGFAHTIPVERTVRHFDRGSRVFPAVLAVAAPIPIFGLILAMFWLEDRIFPRTQTQDSTPAAERDGPTRPASEHPDRYPHEPSRHHEGRSFSRRARRRTALRSFATRVPSNGEASRRFAHHHARHALRRTRVNRAVTLQTTMSSAISVEVAVSAKAVHERRTDEVTIGPIVASRVKQ
ncbi:hypothetical protein [Actinocrinis sp.]|uniref:hypothetical protein n=1 Tax=Actinocrinis sp. TaxID=1920516 RepID=UPI002D706F54|nr:hypothetical protein [Actinocrinis sp.]HZP54584.1 hypothetical protein [Actinocrinis sp.]